MPKKTQRERVVDRIREHGSIDNFWAFHNYILRLGAIIFELRKEGWEFKGEFGTGPDKKNFIYTPIQRPDGEIKTSKDGKTVTIYGHEVPIFKEPKVEKKKINKSETLL
jgi:hypothetical protein